MSEHPKPSELRQWIWGGLSRERSKEVARHLLLGCPDCQGRLAPYAAFAAGADPLPEDVDRGYDLAINRVARKLRQASRVSQENEELVTALLAARRPAPPAPASPAITVTAPAAPPEPVAAATVAEVESLLAEAWQLRFQDPIRMGHLAEKAKNQAERMTAGQARGDLALADLRCHSWLILANALRVRDELSDAHPALKRAFSYFEEGSKSGDLAIQLHEILAALYADERDFASAEESAHAAYRIALDEKDSHRAGKALIQAGTYLGWAGRPREAVGHLERAAGLIDQKREPALQDVLSQNMADFLADCREFKRAERLVFDLHRQFAQGGQDLLRLKLRGIQAKIFFGRGELERAEREYVGLREGLEEAGRFYPAAIASLELSVVYIAQAERSMLADPSSTGHRPILEKAINTTLSALSVFKRLHIDREALGAIILLEKSLAAGKLSRAELQKIIDALRTADRSPRRRLPDEPE